MLKKYYDYTLLVVEIRFNSEILLLNSKKRAPISLLGDDFSLFRSEFFTSKAIFITNF